MGLTLRQWHHRFVQQARWTADLRAYLYREAALESSARVLDLGCGTGALLGGLCRRTSGAVHGLDRAIEHLSLAHENASAACLTQGDAHHLPYGSGSFDVSLCHFLLMWVVDPLGVVQEMARVTRPDGVVLALAEPDYGGRIDYPEDLAELGSLQIQALREQGAEPRLGRRLAGLLRTAGLVDVRAGVLGGQWSGPLPEDEWRTEWAVLRADLEGRAPADRLAALQDLDRAAWARGERILYVPTFYAWGRAPAS